MPVEGYRYSCIDCESEFSSADEDPICPLCDGDEIEYLFPVEIPDDELSEY